MRNDLKSDELQWPSRYYRKMFLTDEDRAMARISENPHDLASLDAKDNDTGPGDEPVRDEVGLASVVELGLLGAGPGSRHRVRGRARRGDRDVPG